MGMFEAVGAVFSKYATFSGRARRAEYWWFFLFSVLAQMALGILDNAMFGRSMMMLVRDGAFAMQANPSPLGGLYSLAVLLPSLAVTARRLHDTDRSGWWMLIWFIPIVGWILMIFWLATLGDRGPNRFGPDPLDGSPPEFRHSSIPRVPRDQ